MPMCNYTNLNREPEEEEEQETKEKAAARYGTARWIPHILRVCERMVTVLSVGRGRLPPFLPQSQGIDAYT